MNTRTFILTAFTAFSCSGIVHAQNAAEKSTSIQQKLDQIIFPTVQFQKATIEDAVEYLRVKSRDLDTSSVSPSEKGVSFILKKETTAAAPITIDLRDVPLGVALKYCVELAGLKYRVEPYGVLIAASFGTLTESPPSLGNADKIIFPTVQFRSATLEEAVEYLRIKSRDLDLARKGVNIIIKPGGAGTKITLDLRNVPLSYALNYIATLSDHQLSTDSNIYVLSPLKSH